MARRAVGRLGGLREEAGQTITEYALLIGTIGVLLIPGMYFGLMLPIQHLLQQTANVISESPGGTTTTTTTTTPLP